MPRCASLTALSLLLCAPAIAWAEGVQETPADPAAAITPSPWAGSSGELGFASAHGNSTTESINGSLKAKYTDGDWIHSGQFTALRSSAQYSTTNDDGSVSRYRETTANRYTGSLGSALQLGEHRQLSASGRYERDDFATYDRLAVVSIAYGTRLIDRQKFYLDAQIGPGIRRAHNEEEDREETGGIARGQLDMKYSITSNTDLTNTLQVEAGSYNTYVQNDFGLQVSMNQHFALKAAWQLRHNTQVSDDDKKTDSLTTLNLVYNYK